MLVFLVAVLLLAVDFRALGFNYPQHGVEENNTQNVEVISFNNGGSLECPKIKEPLCGTNGQEFLYFENKCELEVKNYELLLQGLIEYYECPLSFCKSVDCPVCASINEPICALEAFTGVAKVFPNHCEVKREICLTQQDWKIVNFDNCNVIVENSPLNAQLHNLECPQYCTLEYQPVCARYLTLEREFSNECELKTTICQTKQKWDIVRQGPCQSATKRLPIFVHLPYEDEQSSTESSSLVSKEDLTAKTEVKAEQTQCSQFCTLAYGPICAKFRNMLKQFSSNCELERTVCETGETWTIFKLGSCSLNSDLQFSTETKGCPKYCNPDYSPVCAKYDTKFKEFRNKCELQKTTCETKITWQYFRRGHCPLVPQTAKNSCMILCTKEFSPVCVSYNGELREFFNSCEYRKQKCEREMDWQLLNEGPCVANQSKKLETYCENEILNPICATSDFKTSKTFNNTCQLVQEIKSTRKYWSILHKGACNNCSLTASTAKTNNVNEYQQQTSSNQIIYKQDIRTEVKPDTTQQHYARTNTNLNNNYNREEIEANYKQQDKELYNYSGTRNYENIVSATGSGAPVSMKYGNTNIKTSEIEEVKGNSKGHYKDSKTYSSTSNKQDSGSGSEISFTIYSSLEGVQKRNCSAANKEGYSYSTTSNTEDKSKGSISGDKYGNTNNSYRGSSHYGNSVTGTISEISTGTNYAHTNIKNTSERDENIGNADSHYKESNNYSIFNNYGDGIAATGSGAHNSTKYAHMNIKPSTAQEEIKANSIGHYKQISNYGGSTVGSRSKQSTTVNNFLGGVVEEIIRNSRQHNKQVNNYSDSSNYGDIIAAARSEAVNNVKYANKNMKSSIQDEIKQNYKEPNNYRELNNNEDKDYSFEDNLDDEEEEDYYFYKTKPSENDSNAHKYKLKITNDFEENESKKNYDNDEVIYHEKGHATTNLNSKGSLMKKNKKAETNDSDIMKTSQHKIYRARQKLNSKLKTASKRSGLEQQDLQNDAKIIINNVNLGNLENDIADESSKLKYFKNEQLVQIIEALLKKATTANKSRENSKQLHQPEQAPSQLRILERFIENLKNQLSIESLKETSQDYENNFQADTNYGFIRLKGKKDEQNYNKMHETTAGLENSNNFYKSGWEEHQSTAKLTDIEAKKTLLEDLLKPTLAAKATKFSKSFAFNDPTPVYKNHTNAGQQQTKNYTSNFKHKAAVYDVPTYTSPQVPLYHADTTTNHHKKNQTQDKPAQDDLNFVKPSLAVISESQTPLQLPTALSYVQQTGAAQLAAINSMNSALLRQILETLTTIINRN